MILLDGKQLSQTIKAELKVAVDLRRTKGEKTPHLAAILVGNDPASEAYIRSKVRACEQVGFESTLVRLPDSISESDLLAQIALFNNAADIDGFIVQLPLPKHIDENKVILAIDPRKDVDGFHPVNFGRMAQGMSAYLPATPFGILQILERYDIPTDGQHCVVVGRSNIVGTPISILLSRKAKVGNCTVTLAHSRTRNLAELCRSADILIAAIGIPHFIKADMVREGAVVIDVGINRIDDFATEKGSRLVGDVDFEAVAPKCSYITPVPGGVGLLTVVALLQNTLKAAEKTL
jgi:methylenetetrahydrofolate dehydrogenase (NADP+) / methenyltetrahydrofolate cyclohydrolase